MESSASASDLSSNAQSMQVSLPAECTISWDLLDTVSERPENFFQPDLTTVGGLPIDIRVRLESGQLQWQWYRVIRKLNIPDRTITLIIASSLGRLATGGPIYA